MQEAMRFRGGGLVVERCLMLHGSGFRVDYAISIKQLGARKRILKCYLRHPYIGFRAKSRFSEEPRAPGIILDLNLNPKPEKP